MATIPNQELDYTTIDRPYNGSLNRTESSAVGLGNPSLLEGGATDQSGDGASVNVNNKITRSGEELTDIWLNTWIKSKNYLPKRRGFFLDAMSGYIECMNVFISGDVTATTGNIGGFVIGADYLRDLANSFGLSSDITSGDDVRFWAGSTFELRDTAPFRITESGVLTAESGTIGGWTINPTTLSATGIILDAANERITVGSAIPSIIIDGIAKNIRTSSFVTGASGWSITKDGDAEFNNLFARGEFHTQVLSYGSVHVTAGSNLLALSGGTLKNTIVTVDNGGLILLETGDLILLETGDDIIVEDNISLDVNDPPTGHLQVFIIGDILRIKDGSGNDNWFTVASVVDETTYFKYTCTKSSGTNATFYAGAAVADYGQSGQGLIFSTVDSVNSPYISVQTHAGSPWSGTTERVRMGNLNGFLDYATNIYGFAVGASSSTNANITIDPTNGIRIRNGVTNVMTLDNSGNASFAGSITAAGGTIAGWTIAATTLTASSGGNSTVLSSGATAFAAGPTGSPTVTITQAGVLTASGAVITGSITASTGTIGGFDVGTDYIRDTANTFGLASTVTGGDDVRFWAGAAFASRATAPTRITEAGAFTATSATITGALTTSVGSSLDGQYLTAASVASAKANIALRGWTQTSVFSVTDLDTVAWGTGTFTSSDGTAYSISAGNTGNMAARTYIYLDIALSTTAYQTTTTASTAVGNGKVLIATAINGATEPTFTVFGGIGGLNIDAASIVAGSITANEIAANTITAANMNVSSLSAISANLGTITAGNITLDSSGYIRGGQTAYNTGTGFFLGYSSSAYKFSIGSGSADNSLTWDGTVLIVNGSAISNNDIFGSGNDGAFTLDGTNTYATFFSKSGSTYTLLKDIYATDLSITTTSSLVANGYRIFAKGTLTVNASCYLKWNGNAGTNGQVGTVNSYDPPGGGADPHAVGGNGGTGGAALVSGSLVGSNAGHDGGYGGVDGDNTSSHNWAGTYGYYRNGFSGVDGTNVTHSFQTSWTSNSGNGGHGGYGYYMPYGGSLPGTQYSNGAGGGRGANGTISASRVRPFSATFASMMFDLYDATAPAFLTYNGNSGGGGGGGGGEDSTMSGAVYVTGGIGGGGGGSGSGGGTIVIAARTIVNNGSIQALGGNGGNGGAGSDGSAGGSYLCGAGGGGGGGAGAGGGGGVIAMIYSTLSGSGVVSVAAGADGVGGAGGAAGAAGSAGGSLPGGPGSAGGSVFAAAQAGIIIQLVV